jgi:predicted secreted protein
VRYVLILVVSFCSVWFVVWFVVWFSLVSFGLLFGNSKNGNKNANPFLKKRDRLENVGDE